MNFFFLKKRKEEETHLKKKNHFSKLFFWTTSRPDPLWERYVGNLFKGPITITQKETVRLNLFNHVLASFRAKFACNLAIRYLVFRWELCKGSVRESVKNTQMCALKKGLATGSHDCSWLASRQNSTRVKHVGGAKGSCQLLHYRTKLPYWPGS